MRAIMVTLGVLAVFGAIVVLNGLMFNQIKKSAFHLEKVEYTGLNNLKDIYFISMLPGFNLLLVAQLMITYGQVLVDNYKKNKKPHLRTMETVEKIKNIYQKQKERNALNYQPCFIGELDSAYNQILGNKENEAVILLLKSYAMMLTQILVVLEEAEKLPDEKRSEIQKDCVGPLKKFTDEIQTFQEKITAFEQEVQELKFVRLKEIVKAEENNNTGKIFDGNLEKLALASDENSKKK